MERHNGSIGIPYVECINERIGKWRVRWDIRPETKEDDSHDSVSFYELEFLHKPTLTEIKEAVDGSGGFLRVNDVVEMGLILKEDSFPVGKEVLVDEIGRYDKSDAVNSFTLAGKHMWLPKDTRVGLSNSIGIEQAAGKETTSLWFDAVQYEIPIPLALQMLAALELYALECYNITQSHIATLNSLQTIEEIRAYDYTTGYPEQLVFNL